MHNFPFDFHLILTDNCVLYYYHVTNKQQERTEVKRIPNWHENKIHLTIAAQNVYLWYKKIKILIYFRINNKIKNKIFKGSDLVRSFNLNMNEFLDVYKQSAIFN